MSQTVWQKRAAAGLCARCGQRPPKKGRKCLKCFKADKTHQRNHWKARRAKGLCRECGKKIKKGKFVFCPKCLKHRNALTLACRRRAKAEVFERYGGARCACKKCPEHRKPHFDFLTLNHIGGGGNQHRKSLGNCMTGSAMYFWIRKNKFPPGFNVLCFNCQFGYHIGKGKCLH